MVNKQRLYWIFQIGGWLLYAVIQVVSFLSSDLAAGPVSFQRILFLFYEAALCFTVTHGFRIIFTTGEWIRLSIMKLILNVILGVFTMSLAVYLLRIPGSWLLGLISSGDIFTLERFLGLIVVYNVIFFIWFVLYFTYHFFDEYNKAIKYEASRIEIELNNLKSQLNPHFIFNALNSIRALVDENPKKAKESINQLSNILRNSLVADKKGLTRFEDELKMVRDYLGLESIRFEERLITEFEIHPESYTYYVPPLMVQTLVENGIKHGISKLTKGGLIQIKTYVDSGKLKIHIRNSGTLRNQDRKSGTGLGIKNTIKRLKLLYGNHASFRIHNETGDFVLTEIIIPQHQNL